MVHDSSMGAELQKMQDVTSRVAPPASFRQNIDSMNRGSMLDIVKRMLPSLGSKNFDYDLIAETLEDVLDDVILRHQAVQPVQNIIPPPPMPAPKTAAPRAAVPTATSPSAAPKQQQTPPSEPETFNPQASQAPADVHRRQQDAANEAAPQQNMPTPTEIARQQEQESKGPSREEQPQEPPKQEAKKGAELQTSEPAPFEVPQEDAVAQESMGTQKDDQSGKQQKQPGEKKVYDGAGAAQQRQPGQQPEQQGTATAPTQVYNRFFRNRGKIRKIDKSIKQKRNEIKRLQRLVKALDQKMAPHKFLRRLLKLWKSVVMMVFAIITFLMIVSALTIILLLTPIPEILLVGSRVLWMTRSRIAFAIDRIDKILAPLEKEKKKLQSRMRRTRQHIQKLAMIRQQLIMQGLFQRDTGNAAINKQANAKA